MKYTLFAFLIIIAALSACEPSATNSESHVGAEILRDTLTDKALEIFEQDSLYLLNSDRCTSVYLSYPEFRGSGKFRVCADSLNRYIHTTVLYHLDFDNQKGSLGEAAKSIIKDYIDFKSEFPYADEIWSNDVRISILNRTNEFITLSTRVNSDMGGAHANIFQYYQNFHLGNGRKIRLNEVVKNLEELAKIAGTIYSENKEEGSAKTTEGDFQLNDNFALTKEAVVFYFNNDEIVPYSGAGFEIRIPYHRISHLLKMQCLQRTVDHDTSATSLRGL